MISKQLSKSSSLLDFFFTEVMPKIQDIAELKATLYIFYLLNEKRGYPRFVTNGELLAHNASVAGMEGEVLQHALSLAVEHGTILGATLDVDGKPNEVYFINTEADREVVDNIKNGRLGVSQAMPQENIFALYEQNIGVITPMIAEELKEAEILYPAQWIKQAFKEAATMNKRSWKYISRILERWANEGKESGEDRQSVKKGDPNKYIRGRYGHLVRR